MELSEAMKKRGFSNERLERLSGVNSSRIAAYKSGGRQIGPKSAERLAPHVGGHPDELVAESAIKRVERSMEEGDRNAVYKSMKRIISVVEKNAEDVDDQTNENVDRLLGEATKWLEDNPAPANGWGLDEDDDDPYGYRSEGRDRSGRRVVPVEDPDDEGDDVDEPEDEYDEDDDPYGYAAEGSTSSGTRR